MNLYYAFYQTPEKSTPAVVKQEISLKSEKLCTQIEERVSPPAEVKPETRDVSETAITVQSSPASSQNEEKLEQSTPQLEEGSVSVEPETPCQACLCSQSDDAASQPENKTEESQRETGSVAKDDHLNSNNLSSMDISESVRAADKVSDSRMEADDEEEDIDVEEDDECDSSKQDTTADGCDVTRASQSSDSATDYESSPGTDCRRLSESEHTLSWHGHHDFMANRIHELPKPPPEINYLSDTSVMPLDYSQPSHVN